MANKFASMPVPVQSHGNFEFNSMHTTTGDFGRLSVLKCIECVPGDTINFNMDTFIRAAINSQPVNGTISAAAHAFFVRSNLIWSEWDNYIMGLSTPVHPYFTWNEAINRKMVMDAASQRDCTRFVSGFGLNITGSSAPQGCGNMKINALPFRAMQKVWWDYYRDKMRVPDSSAASYLSTSSGHCSTTEVHQLVTPKYRLFPKNYLTSAFDSPAENGQQACVPVLSLNPSGTGGSGNVAVASPSSVVNLKKPSSVGTVDGLTQGEFGSMATSILPISGTTPSIQNLSGNVGEQPVHFNINEFRAAASFQQRHC